MREGTKATTIGNCRALSNVLVWTMFILLFLPSFSYAISGMGLHSASSITISCEGEGQAFIIPEYFDKETISIPCTVMTSDAPLNISCVGLVKYQGDLISIFPSPDNVAHFGRTSSVRINTEADSSTFVFHFSNRDLLHYENFDWEVVCSSPDGDWTSTSGVISTEYPFSEPLLGASMTIFFRDNGLLIALILIIIATLILLLFLKKVVFP